MNEVYCFSGSVHSLAVANFFAEKLGCCVTEITAEKSTKFAKDTAVVVFPVYCQNIPEPVKNFLKNLTSKYVVLIATYGRISYGNVLYEAKKLLQGQVIAGAYVPTGHTFLNGDTNFDKDALLPILKRIKSPEKAQIPKSRKNPLADIFPALRSRISVKIIKNDTCNSCNLCQNNCPAGAIEKGNINSNCIRCLRCVTNCPQKALKHKNSWILQKYLTHYHKDEFRIYL